MHNVSLFSSLQFFSALIPSLMLIGVSYTFFFRTKATQKKIAGVLLVVLVSPLTYVFGIRLLITALTIATRQFHQEATLILLQIGGTTMLSVLALVGGIVSYQRIIASTRGLAALIYGSALVIAASSINMPGLAMLCTSCLLTVFFSLIAAREFSFLTKHDASISYQPFVIVSIIFYLLIIGSMTEVYTLSSITQAKASDAMMNQTYAWTCVIAFIFVCMQFLLTKTIAQGIRGRFTAEENLKKITRLNKEMLETQDKLIQSFSEILEGKSGQSGNHVKRVSEYSALLAKEMGLDEETVHRIKIAAMMHDCGKLMIPNEILEKPARLSEAEYNTMKQHVYFGELMLKDVPGDIMHEALLVATQHHERWDGHGYLRHLAGEEIALSSRIVAVADVFDALTSKRSYKDAWNEQDAYEEIVKNRGTQFAPEVTEAFIRCFPDLVKVMYEYRD